MIERAARMARRHSGAQDGGLVAAASGLGTALAATEPGRLRDGLAGGLLAGVEMVREAARGLLTALRPDGAPAADEQVDGGRKMATAAVLMVFEVAERMAASTRDVLWCAGDDGGPSSRLLAAPVDVAGLVRSGLFRDAPLC